ncbi:MAG: hydrolase [Spirochaetales bacterium]|nr:hydrolase [Spirochaetales bacterium]
MRIILDNTAVVIVDVQERLLVHMHDADRTCEKILTLIRGARALEAPLLVTEQYPKGLGPTVASIAEALDESVPRIIKSTFSCCDDAAFGTHLASLGRKTVLLAGIEAHVCVLQTALDLLETGYQPVVVLDATSSRNAQDREIAARRIEREGGRITSVESILFELTRISGTARFKEISKLVK